MAGVFKKGRFADYLLKALAIGGVVTLSVVAPEIMVVMTRDWRKKKWSRRKVKQSLTYLSRSKIISYRENEKGEIKVKLLEKGREKIKSLRLGQKIERPKRWDGKWRLVVFDVPEKKKEARDFFRFQLKQLGFIRLANSVYIHPFPCEKEVEFLRQSLGIRPDVRFLLVNDFEGIGKIKEKFGL